MFTRYLILSLTIVAFMSVAAFADGGFYGSITYKNCDCEFPMDGDMVKITPFGGGGSNLCGVDCLREGYNTSGCIPNTYPPGWYILVVQIGGESNCYWGIARKVYHGSEWQEVNLQVQGPEDMPDRGSE